jgi:hypothetical protein
VRSQRRAPVTVILVHNTRTDDNGLGDFTQTPTPVTVDGAIFEPQTPLEHAGEDQAPVLAPAAWNVPGVHELGADDEVHVGEGDDLVVWYIVGGSTVWLDRTRIPVSQIRPA